MGKKRLRKATRSKGERRNCAPISMNWSILEKELFKIEARNKKKRVCETIPNPDKSCTNMRFIRVCSNG